MESSKYPYCVLIFDEAHHVMFRGKGKSEPLLESLIRQFRELGVGVIVADQHIHLTAAAATGNSYASIFLNQKEPSDVRMTAQMCNLNGTEKYYPGALPVGHAIVKLQDRWRQPFLLRIPHVPVQKGQMTDDRLRHYVQRKQKGATMLPHSGGSWPESTDGGGFGGFPLLDKGLKEDALAFLEDVMRYPDDGVKTRYKRLGYGGSKGNRIKDALIYDGWLETEIIPINNTRKVLLRPSKGAKEVLKIEPSSAPRASITHEYWKHYYTRRFEEQGYQVQLEAPRHGGRVDVLATKDGKRIGIEIETGKSNVIINAKNRLRSGYDLIVVVATTEIAFKKVETQLAKAGLLIPRRVQLVLQDRFDGPEPT